MFLECTNSVCGSGSATATAWEFLILDNSRPLAVEHQTKGFGSMGPGDNQCFFMTHGGFFKKCHSRMSKGIRILWL